MQPSKPLPRSTAAAALVLGLGLLTACGTADGPREAHDPTAPAGAAGAAVEAAAGAEAPEPLATAPNAMHEAPLPDDPKTSESGAAGQPPLDPPTAADAAPLAADADEPEVGVATLGAGCFWCVEAVYEQLDGILSAESGYMGGTVDNPTYEQVCAKKTGHVEVVQLRFDPEVISYDAVLAWFWQLHDPTTRDRQGADVGPQYRSVIFTHDEAQAEAARASLAQAQARFKDPIVTDIRPAERYWVAESYHQEYYFQNRQQGYCRAVIAPKLDKLGLEK